MVLAMACVVSFTAVDAHHSGTAFDKEKRMRLGGVVQEFKWTNPHTWLRVEVPMGDGTVREFAFEGMAVSVLSRWGWTAQTLQPGDRVIVTYSPYRDPKRFGGEFEDVSDPEGNAFGGARQPI